MPGISHFVYGLAIIIPLMYFAGDKINYKAAAIFVLNNYAGPDSFWVYSFIPIECHTLIGFLLWAIPLSVFYSYMTRFSIIKSGKFLKIQDDEKIEVNWRNSYLLTVAGGFSHIFIDMIGHSSQKLSIVQNFSLSLDDIQSWGSSYEHVYSVLTVIGYIIIIASFFLIIFNLNRDFRDQITFYIVLILSIFGITFIFGGVSFSELEASTTFIIIICIFIPLLLVAFAFKDINEHPIENYTPRLTPNQKINIVGGFLLFIGVILLIGSLLVIIFPSIIDMIASLWNHPDMIILAAYGLFVIAILWLLNSVLLIAKKNNIARVIIQSICVIGFVLIIPLVILFTLSENEVNEIFDNKSHNTELNG